LAKIKRIQKAITWSGGCGGDVKKRREDKRTLPYKDGAGVPEDLFDTDPSRLQGFLKRKETLGT